MAGAINAEMKEFIEEWESVSPTMNYFVRLDLKGDEKFEGVQGNRKFKVSTYERMVTQDKIRDPKLDPFANGCFRPVLVPEGVSIETNPNAISDEDIDHIFTVGVRAWTEYMKVIDSPATLRRMIDRAEDSNLPLKRFRELEARLEEVSPATTRIVQKDQDEYDKFDQPGKGKKTAAKPAAAKA